MTACDPVVEDRATIVLRAQTAAPGNARLAAIYARTCKMCHIETDSEAPMTGDRAAWQPLLDRGMSVLIYATMNGAENMPPMGLCDDCGSGDFEELIEFMATAQ